MDLMESLRVLRRRWILTAVMILLALGGVAAAVVKLPRTYVSESSVVLLASREASKPSGGNPYMNFNGSLNLTGDVVRYEVMDPRTAQSLAASGYPGSYLVADATDTPGPILLVTVTGGNKVAVEHTLHGVTGEIGTKLQELQAGIMPADRIRLLSLSVSPRAKLSLSKMARPLVVILGFGLVLAFAVPLIIDAQIGRRRSRSKAGSLREDRDGADRGPDRGHRRPSSQEDRRRSEEDREPAYLSSTPGREHSQSPMRLE
jgi:hypothetical protein